MPFKTLEPNHTQRQGPRRAGHASVCRPACAVLADEKPQPDLRQDKPAPLSTSTTRHIGRSSSTQPHSRLNNPPPERPDLRSRRSSHLPRSNLRVSPFRLPLATNPLHHVQAASGGHPRRKQSAPRLGAPIRDLLPAFLPVIRDQESGIRRPLLDRSPQPAATACNADATSCSTLAP